MRHARNLIGVAFLGSWLLFGGASPAFADDPVEMQPCLFCACTSGSTCCNEATQPTYTCANYCDWCNLGSEDYDGRECFSWNFYQFPYDHYEQEWGEVCQCESLPERP